MLRTVISTIFLAIVLLAPSAIAAGSERSHGEAILGAWRCARGPCFDPEIAFEIEDGTRVFRSWLHHRPARNCEWSLEGDSLTLLCSSGSATRYRVIRTTKKVLVLLEEGEKRPARYRRIE